MQIEKSSVVTIDYTLTGPDGKVIDTSVGKQPLPYLHGHGNLIAGLETALVGKGKGDKLNVTIAPADAYGVRDESKVQVVPKSAFGPANVQVGSQFRTGGAHPSMVTVTKVEGDNVTVDANHPLAGVPLTFDVEIKDVRKASPEEIAHGHVHGPGGHHH